MKSDDLTNWSKSILLMCWMWHFLPMYHGPIFRVNLIRKTHGYPRNIILRICMKYLYMVSRLEFVVHFQTSSFWPYFLYEHNRLWALLFGNSSQLHQSDGNWENYSWLQQNGATPHSSQRCMQSSENIFAKRIISKDACPSRSPDLNPPVKSGKK